MKSTLLGPELGSLIIPLFNHPIRDIMPILSRLLISPNSDDEHYEASVQGQTKKIRTMILPEIIILFL